MILKEHYEKIDTEEEDYLRKQTECDECQGHLDLFVECLDDNQVKEEARCAQCNKLMRSEEHKVH